MTEKGNLGKYNPEEGLPGPEDRLPHPEADLPAEETPEGVILPGPEASIEDIDPEQDLPDPEDVLKNPRIHQKPIRRKDSY